jgi:hypothetical protein
MRRPHTQSLADRILELLYYRDTDPIFVEFCHELKLLHSPISKFEEDDSQLTHYVLAELGVSLYSYERGFYSAHFYIQPVSVEGVSTNPYCNALPFGIETGHTISDVHSLLGPPHEVNKPVLLWADRYGSESYRLEPWNDVVFWYSKPNGKLSTLIVSQHQTVRASET